MIPHHQKIILLVRANYRCEYCRKSIKEQSYELEHIIPVSRGGLTNESNLAIACRRCNGNKKENIEWIDPFSGALFPIFNPRCMAWDDNFFRNYSPLGEELIGKTSIGRATAALLFKHTPQYIQGHDLEWDKLNTIRSNQQLYNFCNHLRFLRLQNNFSTLKKLLNDPIPYIETTKHEQQAFYFIKNYLLIEIFFTRSRNISDITNGIKIAQQVINSKNLTKSQEKEISNLLSILYQQRSTIFYLNKNITKAKQDQITSFNLYMHQRLLDRNVATSKENYTDLLFIFRSSSLYTKYLKVDISDRNIKNCISIINSIDQFESTQYLSFLADLIFSCQKPSIKTLEYLYEKITHMLLQNGYGTAIDVAKLITLRRRWWGLNLLFCSPGWQGTLVQDINYWRKTLMLNELRELKSSISRIQNIIDKKKIKDAEKIIN